MKLLRVSESLQTNNNIKQTEKGADSTEKDLGFSPKINLNLNPSMSERWINCPASAIQKGRCKTNNQFNISYEDYEKINEPEYVREGKEAHKKAEIMIKNWLTKQDNKVNFKNQQEKINLTNYVNYLKQIDSKENKTKINNLSYFVEDAVCCFEYQGYTSSGRVDFGLFNSDTKVLHVVDLKYGEGVSVVAQDNPQLQLYAIGLINKYQLKVEKVYCHIFNASKNQNSYVLYKTIYLEQWLKNTVHSSIDKSLKEKPERKRGKWCQFCPLRNTCKTRFKPIINDLQEVFNNEDEDMDFDSICKLFTSIEEMKEVENDIKAEILKKLTAGQTNNEVGLVTKRTNRIIKDEEEFKKRLIKHGYEQDMYQEVKLKTIRQLEDTIGKEKFDELFGDLIVQPKEFKVGIKK